MSASISIIIPVLNEVDAIEQAVQRSKQIADEVIVADGGSTDGTLELLDTLNCVVCHSKRGRGQQLYAGAAMANGEILLFLHADNWLPADARTQLLQLFDQSTAENRKKLFGCFRQRINDDRFIYRLIESGNYFRAKCQKLPYGDQGIFVSRTLYDLVDGMPQISLMEDFEFSRRVAKVAKLKILQGPLHVDARRWEKVGPIRQSIRNWTLAMRYRLGANPESLVKKY